MASDAISKMDPMLRKLENDVAAVKDALKNEDMIAAEQLLRSINQTSDYLADDVSGIQKATDSPVGPNDIFAGGAPIMQFNETEQVLDVGLRGDLLKGTIMPARIGNIMKPQRSPGQRL